MAINMMGELAYITCPRCKGIIFEKKDTFTLKKTKTNTGEKLHKQIVDNRYYCTKCGEEVTGQIKEFEIM